MNAIIRYFGYQPVKNKETAQPDAVETIKRFDQEETLWGKISFVMNIMWIVFRLYTKVTTWLMIFAWVAHANQNDHLQRFFVSIIEFVGSVPLVPTICGVFFSRTSCVLKAFPQTYQNAFGVVQGAAQPNQNLIFDAVN